LECFIILNLEDDPIGLMAQGIWEDDPIGLMAQGIWKGTLI
jgi:hypothetical protein